MFSCLDQGPIIQRIAYLERVVHVGQWLKIRLNRMGTMVLRDLIKVGVQKLLKVFEQKSVSIKTGI